MAREGALIVPVPAAEPVVGEWRARHDPSAALTAALTDRYPEYPPYRGVFPEVVPHLTVADGEAESVLDEVAEVMATRIPVAAVAEEVLLVVEGEERWRTEAVFLLGADR